MCMGHARPCSVLCTERQARPCSERRIAEMKGIPSHPWCQAYAQTEMKDLPQCSVIKAIYGSYLGLCALVVICAT